MKAKGRKKINSHLLNVLILKKFGKKKAFADLLGLTGRNIYNWCDGTGTPSVAMVKRMAKELDVSWKVFYLPGTEYVVMGIESALTRWSADHQNLTADRLKDNDAITLIDKQAPEVLDAAEEGSSESPFFVQGPTDSPDSSNG